MRRERVEFVQAEVQGFVLAVPPVAAAPATKFPLQGELLLLLAARMTKYVLLRFYRIEKLTQSHSALLCR